MTKLAPPKYVLPSGGGCIYRDMEVRRLLDELWPRPMTGKAMLQLIIDRLGADRAPSRSALYRYVRRARLGLGYRSPALWGRLDAPSAGD